MFLVTNRLVASVASIIHHHLGLRKKTLDIKHELHIVWLTAEIKGLGGGGTNYFHPKYVKTGPWGLAAWTDQWLQATVSKENLQETTVFFGFF